MAIEGLKGFISYSSKDKKLAAVLKKCLTAFGLDVFLAHDDIEPSASWIHVIRAELAAAEIFLPLLTENFADSEWTDQETGFALADEKLIIPLKVDIDPYGFIASIQALKVDREKVTAACRKIARTIGKDPERREKFFDGLIEMLAGSISFAQAAEFAAELNEFEGYTAPQVRRVLLATLANRQIYESWDAPKELLKFIGEYGDEAEPELVKKVKKVFKDASK